MQMRCTFVYGYVRNIWDHSLANSWYGPLEWLGRTARRRSELLRRGPTGSRRPASASPSKGCWVFMLALRHACLHKCVYVYMYMYVCECLYTRKWVYTTSAEMNTYTHMCLYMHIHVYMYAYIHTEFYIHISICIHLGVCVYAHIYTYRMCIPTISDLLIWVTV